MGSTTRERLLQAASALFAEQGFRGASVRDICNLARANPGAVSYHFGGKRQLYRTVVRQAVERVAAASAATPVAADASLRDRVGGVVRALVHRLHQDPVPGRLILRELADGGTVAVEALAPVLRAALEGLRAAMGEEETGPAAEPVRDLFLALASPIFFVTAAWPVLERALELEPSRREALLEQLLNRVLEATT